MRRRERESLTGFAQRGCVITASDLVNLSGLIDGAKCFAFVRQHCWPESVRYPGCDKDAVFRDGYDDTQPCRQRDRCKACTGRFDDLTGTVLAGHHQPLRVWMLCLDASDVQAMTEQRRRGVVARTPLVKLTGEVEPDARASSGIEEVYILAWHKGPSVAVAKRGGSDAVPGWQARLAATRWRRTNHPSSA